MSAEWLVARFRQFLLALAAALCLGIMLELAFSEHWKEPIQLLPFALCGLSLLALAAVWLRPNRNTIWMLRGLMVIAALSGLLGVYEHLVGNLALALEVNDPKATTMPIIVALTGANPPLAPGAMGITAIIALAATYWHPALNDAD